MITVTSWLRFALEQTSVTSTTIGELHNREPFTFFWQIGSKCRLLLGRCWKYFLCQDSSSNVCCFFGCLLWSLDKRPVETSMNDKTVAAMQWNSTCWGYLGNFSCYKKQTLPTSYGSHIKSSRLQMTGLISLSRSKQMVGDLWVKFIMVISCWCTHGDLNTPVLRCRPSIELLHGGPQKPNKIPTIPGVLGRPRYKLVS